MTEPDGPDVDPHADKYHDPRVKITPRRLILMGAGWTLVAVAVALASVYARRTSVGKTTDFFGPATITALQLADRVELSSEAGPFFEPVDLTGTPGLGHLRRALLDDRNYLWETESAQPVSEACHAENSICVRLRFADPIGQRVPVTELALELQEGWVGPAGAGKRVRFNQRVQPAMRHQLQMMSGVSREHYDQRSRR